MAEKQGSGTCFLTEDDDILTAVLSKPSSENNRSKIKIRRTSGTGQDSSYLAETFQGNQTFHRALSKKQVISLVNSEIPGSFKNGTVETAAETISILTNRKGNTTVIRKRNATRSLMKADLNLQLSKTHDRKKNYIIEEGTPVSFLVKLGIMTEEGRIHAQKYSKFRQINRFLEYVRDILPELETTGTPEADKLEIIDFGCGKSYLTFAIYHYLAVMKKMPVHITGIDLKADVIEHCRRTAEKCGYKDMHFICGDVADYREDVKPDLVITLHACDTATDYALAFAVKRNARCILSVPCCQHELNTSLKKTVPDEYVSAMFRYGIIKERLCALTTDVMRAELLEGSGYDTQILEFIDMEDTPKNLLIRAVKRKNQTHSSTECTASLSAMKTALGSTISLDKFLTEK